MVGRDETVINAAKFVKEIGRVLDAQGFEVFDEEIRGPDILARLNGTLYACEVKTAKVTRYFHFRIRAIQRFLKLTDFLGSQPIFIFCYKKGIIYVIESYSFFERIALQENRTTMNITFGELKTKAMKFKDWLEVVVRKKVKQK